MKDNLERLKKVVENTQVLLGELPVKGEAAVALVESLSWLSSLKASVVKQIEETEKGEVVNDEATVAKP